MKISYSKKYMRFNLFMGLLWLIFASASLLLDETIRWSNYFYMVVSALYLAVYWFQKKYHYLTIANGEISENGIFKKTLKLDDIIAIRYFGGDYTLKTAIAQLTINTQIIDQQDVLTLKAELEKLSAQQN